MGNLKAVKGEAYARTVETALTTIKVMQLFSMIASVADEHLDDDNKEKSRVAMAVMMSKIISLCASNGGIKADSSGVAQELMGWADKVFEAEQRGAEAFLRDIDEE